MRDPVRLLLLYVLCCCLMYHGNANDAIHFVPFEAKLEKQNTTNQPIVLKVSLLFKFKHFYFVFVILEMFCAFSFASSPVPKKNKSTKIEKRVSFLGNCSHRKRNRNSNLLKQTAEKCQNKIFVVFPTLLFLI